MRKLLFAGCATLLVAVAACDGGDTQTEAAQNVAAGTAIAPEIAAVMKARHEHYEEMGKAMKGISAELKATSPSPETLQRHAAVIAGYGPQLLTWFPEGSGPGEGRDTRAKDEIWNDPDTFRQRAQAFEAAAANFHEVAQGGNVDAIRAALPDLGASCKNCHDLFRAPED